MLSLNLYDIYDENQTKAGQTQIWKIWTYFHWETYHVTNLIIYHLKQKKTRGDLPLQVITLWSSNFTQEFIAVFCFLRQLLHRIVSQKMKQRKPRVFSLSNNIRLESFLFSLYPCYKCTILKLYQLVIQLVPSIFVCFTL